MPRIVTTTREVFSFSELSDEAKQTAIDAARYSQTDFEWYEYTIEAWQQLLDAIGFCNAEIQFSGFSSQGDGAAISKAQIDPDRLSAFLAHCPKPSECWASESIVDRLAVIAHKLGRQESFDHHWDWVSACGALAEYGFNFRCVNHHYSHENCHSIELSHFTGLDAVDDFIYSQESAIDELRRELCQAIYSDLSKEYDYLTSDEAVSEWLADSDQEYTVDGETV